MLQVTNESNHSAVVRTSINKDIEIFMISKNMARNDVTKGISETLSAEIENNGVIASPLHNWNMIFEENITDYCVKEQQKREKTGKR